MRMTHTLKILAAFLLMTAGASAGRLDGTAWTVKAVPTRQTAAKEAEQFKDVLTFSGGFVSSRELKRIGIEPVAFTAEGTRDFLNWKTTPVLREKNKAQWDGVVNGKNIKGNLKWVTRNGQVRYYYIDGRKR